MCSSPKLFFCDFCTYLAISQPNKSLGEENSLLGRRLKAKGKGRGRGFRAREGKRKGREQLDVQGCLSFAFAYITSWRDGEDNGALGNVPLLSYPSKAVSRPNSVPLSFRTVTMQAANKMENTFENTIENFPNLGLSVEMISSLVADGRYNISGDVVPYRGGL